VRDFSKSVVSVLEGRGIDPGQITWNAGAEDELVGMILYVANECVATEESLRKTATMVQSTLESVTRSLDSGYQLNSLGELQRTGQEYDRLVVVLGEKLKTLNHLAYLLAKKDARVDTLTTGIDESY
jgi:hypothetical protein